MTHFKWHRKLGIRPWIPSLSSLRTHCIIFHRPRQGLHVLKVLHILIWIWLNSQILLWAPKARSWLIGKDPDAGKDWEQEEKGATEDEMVGWHHRLDGPTLSKLQEMVKDREAWRAAVHEVTKSWTWLSNWTMTIHQGLSSAGRAIEGIYINICQVSRLIWAEASQHWRTMANNGEVTANLLLQSAKVMMSANEALKQMRVDLKISLTKPSLLLYVQTHFHLSATCLRHLWSAQHPGRRCAYTWGSKDHRHSWSVSSILSL